MENVSVAKEILSLPDAQSFLAQAQEAFDKILLRAPSDGAVSMNADVEGNLFRTSIKVAAADLRFTLARTARSPFMALEYAVKEALDKIHVWSLLRDKTTARRRE